MVNNELKEYMLKAVDISEIFETKFSADWAKDVLDGVNDLNNAEYTTSTGGGIFDTSTLDGWKEILGANDMAQLTEDLGIKISDSIAAGTQAIKDALSKYSPTLSLKDLPTTGDVSTEIQKIELNFPNATDAAAIREVFSEFITNLATNTNIYVNLDT